MVAALTCIHLTFKINLAPQLISCDRQGHQCLVKVLQCETLIFSSPCYIYFGSYKWLFVSFETVSAVGTSLILVLCLKVASHWIVIEHFNHIWDYMLPLSSKQFLKELSSTQEDTSPIFPITSALKCFFYNQWFATRAAYKIWRKKMDCGLFYCG